ncbi:GDP-L-galactose phosphorylase, putative (macronuclear) [Tetrahymena thermophila SB210]|uniref:GDP-D-glucose phosphorylase 1 n=1 Tax=Tetrahymena thermophila (strain SB210) TaxID=312017 RepID=W7XBR4_TETTS|nr:GDP-L-galactose phosphorylase, putative [Tetrahymena thermophila SB210]EWS71121.1 GDP-L-galactose phosphorylase, putative [Tetrahymena thermophila SB210]|eukprot:XP_012656364.1 GDP-L-galactose phosphorylase, putative [Tetrahymena thermophila SB210]
MVDNTVNFDDILSSEWNSWYKIKGKGAPKSKYEENKIRSLQGGFIAIFNEGLIQNKRAPEFNFDSEEEQNEIKVYKNFDESKFNFNSCPQEEILFYVNLDDEIIFTKEQNKQLDEKNLDEFENNCDKSLNEFINHPIIANVSPIAKNHSLITVYPEECLPQVIGQDILSLVLTTFKLSNSPHMRLGFNSLGAFSSVNHLHFQILYADELFPQEKIFPIEKANKKLVLCSTLQNDQEEINMYSVGVRVEELVGYIVKGLVFSPVGSEGQDISDIFSSLAFAVGAYTNILLDEQIPHNIFISERGQKIYVVPRQYENETKDYHHLCKPAFLETAGAFIVRDQKFFNELTIEGVHQFFNKYVQLSESQFNGTVSKFKSLLLQNFQ